MRVRVREGVGEVVHVVLVGIKGEEEGEEVAAPVTRRLVVEAVPRRDALPPEVGPRPRPNDGRHPIPVKRPLLAEVDDAEDDPLVRLAVAHRKVEPVAVLLCQRVRPQPDLVLEPAVERLHRVQVAGLEVAEEEEVAIRAGLFVLALPALALATSRLTAKVVRKRRHLPPPASTAKPECATV